MSSTRILTLVFATVVGAALMTSPAVVRAQQGAPSAEDLAAAKQAFLEGKELHAAGKLDEAVEKFKLSYRLSKRPQLLYNIALTLEELGNAELAIFYYKKYLSDAPADDAQRAAAEKSLTALQAAAAKQPAGDDPKAEPGADEPKPKKPKKPRRAYTADDYQHTAVEDAPPGKPLDLTVEIPGDAGWTVTLHFRGAGDAKFTPVEMRKRYDERVARIPAEKMSGNAIQYYIEVRDAAGEIVTRTGKSTSPNVVYIDAAAADHFYADLEQTIEGAAGDGDGDAGDRAPLRDGDDEDPLGGGTRRSGGDDDAPPVLTQGRGGALVLAPTGPGYMDVGSKKFSYVKWGATGGALGMLGMSMTFYLMASSQASTLEARAFESTDDSCAGGPPCDTYDAELKDIEAAGARNETISKVTFALGLTAGVVATYWWIKEIKARRKAERALAAPPPAVTGLDSVIAVPVASDDFVGAGAALRF